MEKPQECHLIVANRVFRYIKCTIDHGALMLRSKNTITNGKVYGYTDLDFSGDHDEKKRTAGYIFMIEGAPISWRSREKRIMALSSSEAEYMVASYATC